MDASTLRALETAEIDLMARQKAFVEALRISAEGAGRLADSDRTRIDELLREVASSAQGIEELSIRWWGGTAVIGTALAVIFTTIGGFMGSGHIIEKAAGLPALHFLFGHFPALAPYLPISGIFVLGSAILVYAFVGSGPRGSR